MLARRRLEAGISQRALKAEELLAVSRETAPKDCLLVGELVMRTFHTWSSKSEDNQQEHAHEKRRFGLISSCKKCLCDFIGALYSARVDTQTL